MITKLYTKKVLYLILESTIKELPQMITCQYSDIHHSEQRMDYQAGLELLQSHKLHTAHFLGWSQTEVS